MGAILGGSIGFGLGYLFGYAIYTEEGDYKLEPETKGLILGGMGFIGGVVGGLLIASNLP